ncbi:hypothetical protein A2U01_0036330 [Trifolium medium]|uniref:Uncharacterized protein n=1 Tax=Trifolium medium TaxID=97028 RepID=A0A392PTN6_9FABA|nr:hypothetical protein [Trifolium medium]
MDLLPTIGKVDSLLVQQERQYVIPLDESKILAMAANQLFGNSSYGRGNPNCEISYPSHLQHLQQTEVDNNYVNASGNNEETQSVANEEEHNDSDAGKLFFTLEHTTRLY